MEHLNKVELRGIVGTCRIQNVGGEKIANISVATEQHYQDSEGYYMIEITWHNVRAIECETIQCLDRITKGSKIYILGRLLSRRYTDADGRERSSIDIIAHGVKILD